MGNFKAHVPQFEALGVKVVGLSIDTRFSQKVFADKLELNFPLLSDANRVVSPTLGTLLPEVAGIKHVNYRSVLIIDPNLTVLWKFGESTALQPNVAEVLEQVQMRLM